MVLLKVLEWNINMRSKATRIHSWILSELVKKNPDIIVLVEYKNEKGNDAIIRNYLQDNLEKFHVYYFDGYENKGQGNGVLIALKASVFSSGTILGKQKVELDGTTKEQPNWLHLLGTLKETDEKINIIGMRVTVGGKSEKEDLKERKKQIENLLDSINKATDKRIIIGDYNYGPHRVEWEKSLAINWQDIIELFRSKGYLNEGGQFDNYSPYSPIGYSYKASNLDWLVTKKIKIIKDSNYNNLDWRFTNNYNSNYVNGYKTLEGYFVRTDVSYPDHAIFTVEIEL